MKPFRRPSKLPQTLRGWLVLGYAAVGAALLSTVFLSHLSLKELTHHSERLVQDGAMVSSLGGELRDSVINLERSARQFIALRDEKLLSLYYQRVAKVSQIIDEMEAAGLSDEFGVRPSAIREELAEMVKSWNHALTGDESQADALQRIAHLADESEILIAAGHRAIQQEIEALRRVTDRSRERIVFSVAALFPTALLILWWLLRETSLSLGSLRHGIQSLGQGQHSREIHVSGPQELQDLGERLNWLRKRLAELETEKERFLRHVSHELKTPLASLKEASDLIGDPSIGSLNEQQSELRQILLESCQDLQEQISHLLAYAAWRREQRQLETTRFDLASFAAELKQTFALQLARNSLTLNCQLDGEHWQGHRNRLMEALENLVSNAIKHAPPHSCIELRLGYSGAHAEATVRDFGPGVPDEEKTQIFEPFVRGRQAHLQGLPGTGVGLSIVSECALAHGGEISVEDAHPGSRFILRWPADLS